MLFVCTTCVAVSVNASNAPNAKTSAKNAAPPTENKSVSLHQLAQKAANLSSSRKPMHLDFMIGTSSMYRF